MLRAVIFCSLVVSGCRVTVQLGVLDAGTEASTDAGTDAGGVSWSVDCNPLGSLPLWRTGLARGEWVQLPDTALSTLVPQPQPKGMPDARVNSPTGMAADTESNWLYLAASGGTYSGNEVYGVDLGAEAPKWLILTPPTPEVDVRPDESHGADGRPTAASLYNALWFIEQNHQLMRFGAAGLYSTGAITGSIDAWDPARRDWLPAQTHPSFPGSLTYSMPTAKDFSTGDVYQFQFDNHLYRWSRTNDRIDDLGEPTIGKGSFYEVTAVGSAFDPVHRKLVFFGDTSQPQSVRVFDAVQQTWASVPVTGAAAARMTEPMNQNMGFFDACLNAFVIKTTAVGDVLLLDPVTFEVKEFATTGRLPPQPVAGVHTLFQMVPRLGGYVMQPRVTSGLYFLPTR